MIRMDYMDVVNSADQVAKPTNAWMLRPMAWFAVAYSLIIIVHEGAHALTGAALGIPSRLFNFWVNHDIAQASVAERAAVGVAGPVVSLLAGLACWLLYRRLKTSSAGLPLLLIAASGTTNFFGNLMSVAFVGDFSNAANVLSLPQGVRYAASIVGVVSLSAILYLTGRELRQWAPPQVGRFASVLWLIVVPAVVGTAFIIVVNQPTPMGAAFAPARIAESAFWVFAALGALLARPGDALASRPLGVHWIDGTAVVVTIVAIRIMARGISVG